MTDQYKKDWSDAFHKGLRFKQPREMEMLEKQAARINKLQLRINSPETPENERKEMLATQAEIARDALGKLAEYRKERQKK